MVVIDATMLLLLIRPESNPPKDPTTGLPVTDFAARLAHWIEVTDKKRTKIIIPTPALSEALVDAGPDAQKIVDLLNEQLVFKIAPFDAPEAIEIAEWTRIAKAAGDKKEGSSESWNKVKFDRQIVAIAKVAGATTIYTDDNNLGTFAVSRGLSVVRLWELPLPPPRPPAPPKPPPPAPLPPGLFDEPPTADDLLDGEN